MPRLICCQCDTYFNSADSVPVCNECQEAEGDLLESTADFVPEYSNGRKVK